MEDRDQGLDVSYLSAALGWPIQAQTSQTRGAGATSFTVNAETE